MIEMINALSKPFRTNFNPLAPDESTVARALYIPALHRPLVMPNPIDEGVNFQQGQRFFFLLNLGSNGFNFTSLLVLSVLFAQFLSLVGSIFKMSTLVYVSLRYQLANQEITNNEHFVTFISIVVRYYNN